MEKDPSNKNLVFVPRFEPEEKKEVKLSEKISIGKTYTDFTEFAKVPMGNYLIMVQIVDFVISHDDEHKYPNADCVTMKSENKKKTYYYRPYSIWMLQELLKNPKIILGMVSSPFIWEYLAKNYFLNVNPEQIRLFNENIKETKDTFNGNVFIIAKSCKNTKLPIILIKKYLPAIQNCEGYSFNLCQALKGYIDKFILSNTPAETFFNKSPFKYENYIPNEIAIPPKTDASPSKSKDKKKSKEIKKTPIDSLECHATDEIKVVLAKGGIASDIILPSENATIYIIGSKKDEVTRFIETAKLQGFSHNNYNESDKTSTLHFFTVKDAESALAKLNAAKLGTILIEKKKNESEKRKNLLVEWHVGIVQDFTLYFSNELTKNEFISKYSTVEPAKNKKAKPRYKCSFNGMNFIGQNVEKNPVAFSIIEGLSTDEEHAKNMLKSIQNVVTVNARCILNSDECKMNSEEFLKQFLQKAGINDIDFFMLIRTSKILPGRDGKTFSIGNNLALISFRYEDSYIKAQKLNGASFFNAKFKIQQEVSTKFTISNKTYDKIKPILSDKIKALCEKYPDIQIKDSRQSKKKVVKKLPYVKLTMMGMGQLAILHQPAAELSEFLRGYIIRIDNFQSAILSEPWINEALKNIEQKYNVKLDISNYLIRIINVNTNAMAIEKEIVQILDKEKTNRFIESKFVLNYGINKFLKEIRKEFNAIAEHNIKTLIVEILVSRENIAKIPEINAKIDDFNKKLSDMKKGPVKTTGNFPSCGICFTEINDTHISITTSCNHVFHKDCYKSFLKFSLQPGQIPPICCPQCANPLPLQDLDYNTAEFKQLAEKALSKIINENKGKLSYCGSMGCSKPLRIPNTPAVKCWSCKMNLCSKCLKAIHPEIGCDLNFAGYDSNKIKKCPGCSNLIEKNEGCNHMVCAICKIHFCWKCCVFKSTNGQDIYSHMTKDHGGWYST